MVHGSRERKVQTLRSSILQIPALVQSGGDKAFHLPRIDYNKPWGRRRPDRNLRSGPALALSPSANRVRVPYSLPRRANQRATGLAGSDLRRDVGGSLGQVSKGGRNG